LCDSARSAAEFLCVIFQLENPDFAPFVSTRVFNFHNRFGRILFDATPNGLNRGRRSILSCHTRTLGLCIPWNNKPLPGEREELSDITSVESILDKKVNVNEKKYPIGVKSENTQKIRGIINHYNRVFKSYISMNAPRFEEMYFSIPIQE